MGLTLIRKSRGTPPKRNPKVALVLAGGAVSGGAFKVGGLAQVSTNLLDVDATPPIRAFRAIAAEAERVGVRVAKSEIVGLCPERALNEGVDALGADSPAGRRLENSVAFFEFLQAEMPAMLERWRARASGEGRG